MKTVKQLLPAVATEYSRHPGARVAFSEALSIFLVGRHTAARLPGRRSRQHSFPTGEIVMMSTRLFLRPPRSRSAWTPPSPSHSRRPGGASRCRRCRPTSMCRMAMRYSSKVMLWARRTTSACRPPPASPGSSSGRRQRCARAGPAGDRPGQRLTADRK